MEKKGAQKEMKEEREGKMPNPYRLSHFVAPLYVAPSTTPSSATSHRRVFVGIYDNLLVLESILKRR